MKRLKWFSLTLAFVFFASHSAFACLCVRPDSPKDALKYWSEAVLAGEIIAVERGKEFELFTFKIETVWKGVSDKTVVVQDHPANSSCTAGLKLGERYIVFSRINDEHGKPISLNKEGKPRLFLDTCSWTANLANPQVNKKILKKIGKGKPIN